MNIDIARLSKSGAYRMLTNVIIPRPIAWISTRSEQGISNIAPFSYFMGISAIPPLVGVSIALNRNGNRKDTARNICELKEFVINTVTESNYEKMNRTAAAFGYGEDEFEAVGLTKIPSQIVKPYRVKESPVHMECILEDIYVPPGGAVEIFVGKILLLHIDDSMIRDDIPDPGTIGAVARIGSDSYASLTNIRKLPIPEKP